jgi:hypothetical protein
MATTRKKVLKYLQHDATKGVYVTAFGDGGTSHVIQPDARIRPTNDLTAPSREGTVLEFGHDGDQAKIRDACDAVFDEDAALDI